MGNEKIRTLLGQLHDEIQKTDVDVDTLSLMRELDSDIHALMRTDRSAERTDSVLERARLMEGKFAANHPTAERLLTEVINTLVKMGI